VATPQAVKLITSNKRARSGPRGPPIARPLISLEAQRSSSNLRLLKRNRAQSVHLVAIKMPKKRSKLIRNLNKSTQLISLARRELLRRRVMKLRSNNIKKLLATLSPSQIRARSRDWHSL